MARTIQQMLEDPKVQELVKEAYMPHESGPDDLVPVGVKIKEGLSEDFINKAKRVVKDIPEPTPDDLKHEAEFLKKVFGGTLAAYVCKQDTVREFNQFVSGKRIPQDFEKEALVAASDVAKELVKRMKYKDAQIWMTSPCEYLGFEWPADVILTHPLMVRRAVLWLFA